MAVYLYRERGGKVEKLLITDGGSRRRLRGEQRPPRHNSETVLKGYYDLECAQKFKSNYPKSVLKRVHETALARFESGMEPRMK